MLAIATLVNDDPWLKMPREERIALHRERKQKFKSGAVVPFVAPKIEAPEPVKPAPVRRPEPIPQYRMWFEDLVRASEALIEPAPIPRIEGIQRAVAMHFGIEWEDLVSARRTKDLVWPRQVSFYLCRALTTRSLPDIARRCGGRDHTTAHHAVKKIGRLLLTDDDLANDIFTIKQALGIFA